MTFNAAPSPADPGSGRAPRWAGRGLLAAALLAALIVGSRGVTDEGAVSLQGDMPRYLMDGVFLYDAVGSAGWTSGRAMSYAEHYFARYPALSLGHHPPVLPVSLVPFFAVFGVSVLSARLAILAFWVISIALLYALVARLYDAEVAGWASLLFASSPIMAGFAQSVLSEVPTIALVLLALNALVRFRDSGRLRSYVLFVVAAAASLAARQLAVFMFPCYLVLLVERGGWSRLMRRDAIAVTVLGALLVAPIAVVTLVFSPFNVTVVEHVFSRGLGVSRWRAVFGPIAREEFLPVLGLLATAGILAALVRRDRRMLTGVYWMASVLACVFAVTGPVEPVRYSVFAVPASCLCAAGVAGSPRSRPWRRALAVVLTLAVCWQFWWARGTYPRSVGGYEDAARFVLADAGNQGARTMLYSASIDTGYFVFFVRKHDPAERLVVLRSDKLLTTSLMGRVSVEDRIGSAKEIYPLLDRYGVKLIVIEDRPSGSKVLDWLRDELKGDRFVERRRLPFADEDSPLRGVSLVVYEYKGARAPDAEAVIDMKIPLVGRDIRVPLSDLLALERR